MCPLRQLLAVRVRLVAARLHQAAARPLLHLLLALAQALAHPQQHPPVVPQVFMLQFFLVSSERSDLHLLHSKCRL